jgi:hypothetical protein
MPDNLTRMPDGRILAAGIKGVGGNCPPDSNHPCIQGFVLAEVDPTKMEGRILYDDNGKALINGVSVQVHSLPASFPSAVAPLMVLFRHLAKPSCCALLALEIFIFSGRMHWMRHSHNRRILPRCRCARFNSGHTP